MHLFLTGRVQVGKSTVIRRTVEGLSITPGGYLSYFGADRFNHGEHALYLRDAGEPPRWEESHVIARFYPDRFPEFLKERFETLALEALENRRGAPLILMDECGWLERDAFRFQRRVKALLDGETPILGVLREGREGSWLDGVRRHPKVRLVTVTEENRDVLPQELTAYLKPLLEREKGET